MRSLDRLSSTTPFAWLRAGVDRLRRAMMARSPAVRASLILTPVLGMVVVGYWAMLALVPVGTRYLASGRSFPSDDLIKICQALDDKGITYRVEDRKVEIAAEQYDQAVGVFAKLHVGSRSFDEIRSPTTWWESFVDTSKDKERKEQLRQEMFIERCLNDLDGIVWTLVSIRWPRPNGPRHLRGKPSAFITLETEPNRPLPFRTQQAIPTILISNEPELNLESITVIDRKGNCYFDPRNPSLTSLSLDQAREEDLRKKILEKLYYIKEVHVWVRLTTRQDATPAPVPTVAATPESIRADSLPAMGVNQPIELDEPAPRTAVAAHPGPPPHAALVEHGKVLVNVPRSFYYNHMFPPADQRKPTPEELHETAVRQKEQIIKLVRLEVPESWTVEVETFPDDWPLGRSAVLPDARRKATDWGIVAVAAAAVALLTALASWIQVVRRPARIPELEVRTRRYRTDSANEPNPSERVRELVHRDPEAAASVLQRWTTQGGTRLMTTTRSQYHAPRPRGPTAAERDLGGPAEDVGAPSLIRASGSDAREITPLRKAAIVLVSLEQSLASQLLSHLDRSAVEMVTWEIARLDRVDPDERAAVLEEFYDLGLRRLCFVFDDLVKMSEVDIRAAFHEEDRQTWALALAGAAATVRAKVLGALSSSAAAVLRQHLDNLGPFRLSDSETAQLEVADRLRRLYDHDRISLPEPSGSDEVLV